MWWLSRLGWTQQEIADTSATDKTRVAIRDWIVNFGETAEIYKDQMTSQTDPAEFGQKRDQTIRDMWLACKTEAETADEVDLSEETVRQQVSQISELFPKVGKLAARYEEPDWKPPLYDIWNPGSARKP